MDDVTREWLATLENVPDPDVRAREIFVDATEFLHAEIRARAELTLRTRGAGPPYVVDGSVCPDQASATALLRRETVQIVQVMTEMAFASGRVRVHDALLRCKMLFLSFGDTLRGGEGFVLRSAYLGRKEHAAGWLAAMCTLSGRTSAELAALIAAQTRETMPVPRSGGP